MPEANTTEARTETGEIKDQTQTSSTMDDSTKKTDTSSSKTDGTTAKPSVLNDKTDAPAGAPEKYEPFTVPEGFELTEETTKEIGDLFKGMNLSQSQGQQLIDYYSKQSQQAAEAPVKLWLETQEKWVNDVNADPEIGPKLSQVKITTAKVIDSLGPELAKGFREAMDFTGAGNNLAFIKAFYKLAQMVTEGPHVAGNKPSELGQRAPGAAPLSAARALYPTLP